MRNRVRRLSRADRAHKIFGASKHQYELKPVQEQELRDLEALLGTDLPDEFRRFLLDCGAGAGPYYGLFTPSEILSEMDDLWAEYEAELGRRPSPAAEFPISRRTAARFSDSRRDTQGPHLAEYPLDGCIPISFHGCTFWTLIVTTGELRGTLWDAANYVGFEGQWVPAQVPPGLSGVSTALPEFHRPPTFLKWYGAWVDRGSSQARAS